MARVHTAQALGVLAKIMLHPKAPASARIAAAQTILDRGWGKPAQAIVGSDEHPPVRAHQRIELVIVKPQNPDGERSVSETVSTG